MTYPNMGDGFTREEFKAARRAVKSGGYDGDCKMNALCAAIYARSNVAHKAGIHSSMLFESEDARRACVRIHLRAVRYRRLVGNLPSTSRFHLRNFP